MQGYQSLIRQMRVHVAMASHWARNLWRVDIQRRRAVSYPQTKGLRIYGVYYKSYGRHRDEHYHNAAKQG